jgi:hypothetical protein
MHNSLKMDVLDELRLFREKRQSKSTFYTRQLTPFQIQTEYESEFESETWIWNCRADRTGPLFTIKLFEWYSKFKYAVQSVCKQRLCLHFGIQNIEFYLTTIYIFMILEYNKLSRHNNQALQEHKMK